MRTNTLIATALAALLTTFAALAMPASSQAGDRDSRYERHRGYYPYYYTPYYGPRHSNPVVRRDRYDSGDYAPDGTYHSESVVEDRHRSYYSPGRNQAITRPRTTVDSWSEAPGQVTTQQKTSWIGADGRRHSTTVTRDTTVDAWGNTHTDTQVNLRKAK